jgi:hypothetical protein
MANCGRLTTRASNVSSQSVHVLLLLALSGTTVCFSRAALHGQECSCDAPVAHRFPVHGLFKDRPCAFFTVHATVLAASSAAPHTFACVPLPLLYASRHGSVACIGMVVHPLACGDWMCACVLFTSWCLSSNGSAVQGVVVWECRGVCGGGVVQLMIAQWGVVRCGWCTGSACDRF